MEIEELNHVAIWVKDVEESALFYTKILGLKAIDRPEFDFPGAWFQLGKNQELHLIGKRKEDIDFHKHHHFALKVKSSKEVEEILRSKGVAYTGPKYRPDGALQIFIQDPDGYYIELFES